MRRRGRAARAARAPLLRAGGAALALLSLVGCGGCSPLYLLRSAYEEGRVLWRREPIDELLARPGLDADTRRRLELVLEVRRFAGESLGLEVGGAYSSYAEVPPGALLSVVSAAERTRLVAYEWWFPIVGHVSYKGYFSRPDAAAEAARLEARGYDTWVRPSVAFSTLGWFDDPVLSSWMRGDRVRLADLVLHELLHRTTYLRGQTSFNESFANFVGHRGAIAFFAATEGEDAEATHEARDAWREELAESVRLMGATEQLRELYTTAERESWPVERVLEARRPIFAGLGDPGKVNNAVVLARSAYLDRLELFERVFDVGGGELRATIAQVRAASEARREDPFAALRGLGPTEP